VARKRSINLEPVYVRGTHQEFVDAVGDKIGELIDRNPDGADFEVTGFSHTLAFSPSGEMHWSGFMTAELTWEEDS
jgi:hypothetical protein